MSGAVPSARQPRRSMFVRAVTCATDLHANKALLSKTRVSSHTAFSGSRLKNESLPRISTCLWKWAGDGRMDSGGQRRDEPARGLELRNEARSPSQSSGRNRLGTLLRLIFGGSRGLGQGSAQLHVRWCLEGDREGAGTRGRGSVTPGSFRRGIVVRSLRLCQI